MTSITLPLNALQNSPFSTAPCLLIIAVERYLLVCHSAWSKQILTNKNRQIFCACLTLLVVGLITAAFVPTFLTNYNPKDCDKSFYPDFITRFIYDGFIFFLVPAIMCMFLYSLVAFRLWKVRQNASRNKNLTIAFLLTRFVYNEQV